MSLELMASLYRDIQSTRYSELGSSTIIVFEHFITLGDEIDLIWRSPWSPGKVLFIINRYYGLFSVLFNNYGLFTPHLTDHFCRRFFQWQGWTGLIACMIAEVILQMRLYALYLLNKKVLVLMVTSFIIASAGSATVMGIVLGEISVTSSSIPGVSFCTPLGIPSYFYAFWVPIIIFESLLCGLAIFRGWQTFRSSGTPFQSGKHLVGILIRDSILYFLCMFATYFTNLLVWVFGRQSLLEIPIGFSLTMSCVLANRIILNTMQARQKSRDAELQTHHRAPSRLPTGEREKEVDEESGPPPSDIDAEEALRITDTEMLQLRSLRADVQPVGGSNRSIVV